MPLEQKVTVPVGGRAVVELWRRARGRIGAPGTKPGRPLARDVEPWGTIRTALFDLMTVYRTTQAPTGDPGGTYPVGRYDELPGESGAIFTLEAYARVRGVVLANWGDAEVALSGRTIRANYQLAAGSDETDGSLTTLRWRHDDTDAALDIPLIAETANWQRAVPRDEREQELRERQETAPVEAQAAYTEAILAVEAEQRENWDGFSRARTGSEGTATARTPPGAFRPEVTSQLTYESFGRDDKWTEEPAAARAEVEPPIALVGVGESAAVEVYLMPILYDIWIAYYALYHWQTIFGGGGFFAVAQTRRWRDRLPFYPYAYRQTELGNNAINDVAMAQKINRSATFQAALNEDYGLQVFSPYIVIVFDSRIGGRWMITANDTQAGQLLGIVRYAVNGGPWNVRYGWARVRVDRPFEIVDFGPLDILGVVSSGLFDFKLTPLLAGT